jgi:hypothetical protein
MPLLAHPLPTFKITWQFSTLLEGSKYRSGVTIFWFFIMWFSLDIAKTKLNVKLVFNEIYLLHILKSQFIYFEINQRPYVLVFAMSSKVHQRRLTVAIFSI